MAKATLENQFQRFKKNLAVKLGQASLILKGGIKDIIAIDTGDLDNSVVADPVVDRGNVLSADVGSEGVPYAVYVDQGVKRRTYNYHRNKKVVYTGIGQKYMERALINKQNEIRSKLREASI